MPFNKDLLYWNKKDGETILIQDMSNEYLLNTINNIKLQATVNGKLDESKLHPKYNVLRLHAIKRDLIKTL